MTPDITAAPAIGVSQRTLVMYELLRVEMRERLLEKRADAIPTI
jgi:hypothetical protein